MTIITFIEKAKEGGWEPKNVRTEHTYPVRGGAMVFLVSDYYEFLDPEAWKAVWKVEGWQERCMDCDGDVVRRETPGYPNFPYGLSWCPNRCPAKNFMSGWHHKMHLMITALAEGKTIEQYLETL